jgi:hypothetical protein
MEPRLARAADGPPSNSRPIDIDTSGKTSHSEFPETHVDPRLAL